MTLNKMNDEHRIYHASILDRLIDIEDNRTPYQPVLHPFVNLKELKWSILRDVENLLNTKRTILKIENIQHSELKKKSLLCYGVSEYFNVNLLKNEELNKLSQDLASNIKKFEPRLKNIEVQIHNSRYFIKNLTFKVKATISLKPEKIPVYFDTTFSTNNEIFSITNIE